MTDGKSIFGAVAHDLIGACLSSNSATARVDSITQLDQPRPFLAGLGPPVLFRHAGIECLPTVPVD